MFKILSIFILLLIIRKLYNITIIKHLNDGYYIYYEYKEFDAWFKKYSTRINRVCIWRFKNKFPDEDLPY